MRSIRCSKILEIQKMKMKVARVASSHTTQHSPHRLWSKPEGTVCIAINRPRTAGRMIAMMPLMTTRTLLRSQGNDA